MKNDGFWVHWFTTRSASWNSCLSCPSRIAVQGKHTLGQGMQGKDESDTHLEPCSSQSPAAQVQCQAELDSKSKGVLARNVAPSTLEPPELQTLPVVPWASLNRPWTQSTGLVVHPFRPALKYIKKFTKPCLLKIFWLHMHSEIHGTMVFVPELYKLHNTY